MLSTYLHLSIERFYQPLPENRGLEKVKESLTESFKKKVSDALEYVSEASIYSPEDTVPEHTTAQTFLLTLFYGLLFGDLPLCEFILQLQVPQLKSTFLRVWLADDFFFSKHDVSMVISMLSYMLDSKKVVIPDHILMNFGGLIEKYNVADCCSKKLLAVFNSGKVTESESKDAKEKSSMFSNNGLNNIQRETNTGTIRRTSKLTWFLRNQESKDTKEVDNEDHVIVTKKDYEIKDTNCQSEPNISTKIENISPSSEAVQEEEPVKKISATKDISRTFISEDHSKERTLQMYNVVDREGRTLLHRLAQFGRTEAVRRLLDEGVNPDVQDYLGKTALHWAVEYGHSATVELLLKAGVDVNARTKVGRTPLSFAYFKSGVVSEIWKMIVEQGGTI